MIHNIRWRIAIPYVALILLIMAGLSVYVSHIISETQMANLQAHLTAEARLIADELGPLLAAGEGHAAVNALVRHQSGLLNHRITVIDVDGTVLGDSHATPSEMDNHRNRPEVRQALSTGEGVSVRHSRTLDAETIYAAAAIKADGQTIGVARVAVPITQYEANVSRLYRAFLGVTLLTTPLAILLAIFIAGRTTRPIRQLTAVAQRLSQGYLSARLLPTTRDEIGQLTHAFNRMAEQLQEKISTLTRERGQLIGVLSHMADGVIITDDEGRIQLINAAAARLLDTTEEAALGRPCAQILRHHQLIELWRRCYEANQEQIETIETSRPRLFLQAIITPLKEVEPQGCLIILQDLTRVRRLETIRRDFISNISHELRTPLASLKALTETLRDSVRDDPPAAQRFLDHVEAEVDVLTQMVQELLELSRIESGQVPMRFTPTPARDVVMPPVERLRPQAARAGVALTVDVPADLPPLLADAERVQQVITNLLHNAIKFTPSGGEVSITARASHDEIVISVRDTGIGIPAEDLHRIFERFYKADRARSGGGTGLGLAIAKHIVQAHGGHIWAESVEGRGSTFSFTLPASRASKGTHQ